MAQQEELVKDTQSAPLPPLTDIYFLMIDVMGATDLERADFTGSSDPFCKVIAKKQSWKTKTIEKNLNPQWNENTSFVFFEPVESIKFEVYDWDKGSKHDMIGQCTLETASFYNQDNQGFKGSIKLQDAKKGSIEVGVTGRKVSPLQLEQRCNSLENQTKQQAQEINAKNEECTTLMAKNAEMEKTKQSLLKNQQDLNDQLNKIRDQIAAQKQKNEGKQAEIDKLKKQKNTLKDKIQEKEQKLAQKQQEIQQEKQKLANTEKEHQSLQDEAARYREEQGYKIKDAPNALETESSNKSELKQPLISGQDGY